MLRRGLVIALCVVAALTARAFAQDFPSRPVTFLVPFAPGGVTDLFARILAQNLEKRLGKPFIVENKPGGSGITAALDVAHANPDGYTIMMASSTLLALNVTVHKNLPYDPRKDLTPVSLLARVPFVLVVNPDLPVHSVADLVKLAKDKPGQIAFGTPGPGTFHHLNAEMFKGIFGLDLIHVPYKGALPALTDLAGGHIQMMFSDVPPALPLIQAGKVRALGVTTAQRVPAVPDIPPLAEVGMPGYDTASWHTVTTTANVPAGVVAKLHDTIAAIMSDPDVVASLVRDGAIPQQSPPPDELKRFVASEIERWGKVVREGRDRRVGVARRAARRNASPRGGTRKSGNFLQHLAVEAEHAGGIAAEDVALGLLAQKRQVVDHARQVEVPVRVVGRPHQLRLGIDHLEGRFQDRLVVGFFHRLRRVEHLAHVFARLALRARGSPTSASCRNGRAAASGSRPRSARSRSTSP